MDRAVSALVPFVHHWRLALNPEQLREIAGAVLSHFDSADTLEDIDRVVRVQLEGFDAATKRLSDAMRQSAGDGAQAAPDVP